MYKKADISSRLWHVGCNCFNITRLCHFGLQIQQGGDGKHVWEFNKYIMDSNISVSVNSKYTTL